MGQGWPFVACPWSGDGMREPRRSRGRMVGCPSLWLLSLGQARESDSPVRGETKTKDRHANDRCPDINSAKKHTSLPVRCHSTFPNPSEALSLCRPRTRRHSFNCHIRFIEWSRGLQILGPVPSNTILLGARHETEAFDGGPDFRRRWRKRRICCSRRRPGSASL